MKKILIITLAFVSGMSLNAEFLGLGDFVSRPTGWIADGTEAVTGPIPIVGEAGYVAGETVRTAGNVAGDAVGLVTGEPLYRDYDEYPSRTREQFRDYRDGAGRPTPWYRR